MEKSPIERERDWWDGFWDSYFRYMKAVASLAPGKEHVEKVFLEDLPLWKRQLEKGMRELAGSVITRGKTGLELRPPPRFENGSQVRLFFSSLLLWIAHDMAISMSEQVIKKSPPPLPGGTPLTFPLFVALAWLRAFPARITCLFEGDDPFQTLAAVALSVWAERMINLDVERRLRNLMERPAASRKIPRKHFPNLLAAVYAGLRPVAGNEAVFQLFTQELRFLLNGFFGGKKFRAEKKGPSLVRLVTSKLEESFASEQKIKLSKSSARSKTLKPRKSVKADPALVIPETSLGIRLEEFKAKADAERPLAVEEDHEEIEALMERAALIFQERESLWDYARGVPDKETASRLGIAPATVRVHRRNARRKLERAKGLG
jgi:DNA-binding CsgD family transcriptional regulator